MPALATGLRVLCGHGVMDNADEAFKLFDANGDGIIDKQEMESFLSAVFAVSFGSLALRVLPFSPSYSPVLPLLLAFL